MGERIPVFRPSLWGGEVDVVRETLEDGWLSSVGGVVQRFESGFAQYVGVRNAVAVANGTCALELALDVVGVGPGDEVIVPDFTMISPVLAILRRGARPILVDADSTWNIDVSAVEARIGPRTRCILAVHTYGHPARVDRLADLARRRDIPLVEDCAEALGAELEGRAVGTYGTIACYSFYANKAITTGEGGMVTTDDDALADRARWKRNLCFGTDAATRFVHEDLGYNYRMSSLQAALGLAQLVHVDRAVKARIDVADRYDEAFADLPGVQRPPRSSFARNVFWVYGILVRPGGGSGRDQLQQELAAQDIETRRFFVPAHAQPILTRMGSGGTDAAFPVATALGEQGLYLPSFPGISDEQLERVVAAVRASLRA